LNRSSKAKTIALAIEHFSPYKGGAESYAVSLASTLARNGWTIHLFGLSWDGEPPTALFHRMKIPRFLPSWAKMLYFALKHKRMVEGQYFDVILGFGNTVYMNVYQSHGGVHRFSTIRKIHAETNKILRLIKRLLVFLSLKDKVRHWIESAPFRLNPTPTIIAISQMVRSDMASFYGINEEEIQLIYNGVDTEKYNVDTRERMRGPIRQQLSISEDHIAFLFVSYDLKKKGIVPLIKATAELKEAGVHNLKVLVVGEHPYRSVLRLVSRLGLKDIVLFMGPTTKPEEYYANCDVLVLPTYYDACSLVAIEAMCCGLPVITTEFNGAAGIISNGKDGYIVSHPPVHSELAQAMKTFKSRQRLKEMSRAASTTGEKYSIKNNHLKMMMEFDRLIESRHANH
jgi:UDP-glucose:(heptosyl)LPS alpha-1,3-glucosyltransferase